MILLDDLVQFHIAGKTPCPSFHTPELDGNLNMLGALVEVPFSILSCLI
jgi:hypothetical protein